MADYQIPHTYTRGCPEVLAVATVGEQRAMALVSLAGCPEDIIASVERDPSDPTGYTALLTWQNTSGSTVSVRWDGGDLQAGQPATGTLSHVYETGQEGTHTALIVDEDDPSRNVTISFEVPLSEMLDLRISPDPSDPTGYTAMAIWGPTDVPPPIDELDITISPDPGDPTGYTALATWGPATQGEGGGA